MKTNFKFDKKTGTMVADDTSENKLSNVNQNDDVRKIKSDSQQSKPEFDEERKMNVKSDIANVYQNQVLQMKRVNKPSAVQLVDENGAPEAYLDSVTAGVTMFRERQDYDIYQIVDERTNKPLAYIGGYALQISFNMAELKSMEKIEQCLGGLTKLFRKFIMEQALNR